MNTGISAPILSAKSPNKSFKTYKRNSTEIEKELRYIYDRNLKFSGGYKQLIIVYETSTSEFRFQFISGYGFPSDGDITAECTILFNSKSQILDFLKIIQVISENPEKNLTYDFKDLVIKSKLYQKGVFGANINSNCKYASFICSDEVNAIRKVLSK